MAWRLAASLEKLREQINESAPNRSKKSDGSIGDTRHSHNKSDHNENSVGVVTAIDITHDPVGGLDSYALARYLVDHPDPRLKYVISNGKIASRDKKWVWRKYTGSNPHDHHVHISVMASSKLYDARNPWDVKTVYGIGDSAHDVHRHPLLKQGDRGEDVKVLQRFLGVEDDGSFGPATEKALRAYQKAHKLTPDGVAGPYTWRTMEKSL